MPRAAYERMRAAHLDAVQAALEDHVARLDWSRQQIERYQNQRLRALLAYARERSPFHARRLRALDPSRASVADLASLPMMTKQDAQEQWDAIVTAPGLDRDRAERVLAEQQWFSYTAGDQQIFSSGGSSGVRGVYVWDWQFFVIGRLPGLANAGARRAARITVRPPRGLRCWRPVSRRTPARRCSMCRPPPGMETVVIAAGAPFDEVLAAVAAAQPTHLVGYPTVIGRLARAAMAGDLRIEPVRVSTNSEPLLDEDRAGDPRGVGRTDPQPLGFHRNRRAGRRLRAWRGTAHLRGRGRPRTCRRQRHAGRPRRTGGAHARHRAGQPDLPVHSLRPRRSSHVAAGPVRMRQRLRARRRHRRAPRRRLPLRRQRRCRRSRFATFWAPIPAYPNTRSPRPPTGADIVVVGTSGPGGTGSALIAALRRYGLPEPTIRIQVAESLQRHQASGKLRRFIPL